MTDFPAKARELADKLTDAVEVDVHLTGDIEPRVEIVDCERLILAALQSVERETREATLREAAECRGDLSDKTPGYAAGWRAKESAIRALLDAPETPTENFQSGVHKWLLACFGPEIAADKIERNHRFLEESLELVQACGCSQSEAHQLVDYVFNRPVGEIEQEIGGVMNTLAALCLAHSHDMMAAGEKEMRRVWTMVEKIRAKQAAKPKHSPLPETPPEPDPYTEPFATLEKLRDDGWMVAAHNDYRQNGIKYTFWLFTNKDFGRYIKGEAHTDLDALRAALALARTL